MTYTIIEYDRQGRSWLLARYGRRGRPVWFTWDDHTGRWLDEEKQPASDEQAGAFAKVRR